MKEIKEKNIVLDIEQRKIEKREIGKKGVEKKDWKFDLEKCYKKNESKK